MIRERLARRGLKRPTLIRLPGSSKKERRIIKLVASLDHFVVRVTLTLLVLYVLTYGYFLNGHFNLAAPQWAAALALIPIWLIDGLKGLIETFMPATYKTAEEDLSKVTVVIPTKDGGKDLDTTLANLTRRFAPENIIVVSNGSTDDTVEITQSHGATCLEIIAPVGKVRAINYALDHITTPLVLLIDDDTLIDDARIPTGLLEKDGYEAVAFRVLVNTSTWVTHLQMHEYRKSTDIGKRFHNRRASVQNISGAIGLFKLSELQRQVTHHTHEFAGEDLQRTLLAHLSTKAKGVVLTDAVVHTDPPATLKDLFNQRTLGWFPGLYVNFKNYLRILQKHDLPFALRYDAFYNAFLVMLMDILRVISLPILIFNPWYFLMMYLVYIVLEAVSYVRCGSHGPYWVVFAYPFYGLFGFITRVCAFSVFWYRRVVAAVARTVYFDDYKTASTFTKAITIAAVALTVETILLCYVAFVHGELVSMLSLTQ